MDEKLNKALKRAVCSMELYEQIKKKKTNKIYGYCAKCKKKIAMTRAWKRFCSMKCKTNFHQRNFRELNNRVFLLEEKASRNGKD